MGNNFTLIVASRSYMYAAVAGYEVIAGGYPDHYRSLAGQLHGLCAIPKPPAGKNINYELAALLAYCKLGESVTFPAGSMEDYVDSLKKMAKDHGMPDDVFENSIAFADTVSSVILNWSKQDKYAETRSASRYSVSDTPLWQHPQANVLYVGFPVQGKLGIYSIDDASGSLTYQSSVNGGAASCWIRVTKDGKYLYLLNSAENTISVYNSSSPYLLYL